MPVRGRYIRNGLGFSPSEADRRALLIENQFKLLDGGEATRLEWHSRAHVKATRGPGEGPLRGTLGQRLKTGFEIRLRRNPRAVFGLEAGSLLQLK